MNDPRKILDFSQPFDVTLFDNVVSTFYAGTGNRQIHDILAQFQQSPEAWKQAPAILQKSQVLNSKLIALNVLTKCIQVQWKVLPPEQKKGMKAFIEDSIVTLAQKRDQNLGPFLTKLNGVLIEIVKREWPHNWPNFISQVVEVSKKSESVCANNMKLLRILSEEAFDNVGDLTHGVQSNLQANLNKEFGKVFELCMFVLKNSSDAQLLAETFQTLLKFFQVKWIPIQFVFESELIEALTLKYFNILQYRNSSLECLVEIAGISDISSHTSNPNAYNDKLAKMYMAVLQKTYENILRPDEDVNECNRTFVQHLINFLFNVFRYHRGILERTSDQTREALKAGLRMFLGLSKIEDLTLFSICVEFWEIITKDLNGLTPTPNALMIDMGSLCTQDPRYQLYKDSLHSLKFILMARIPRPKEVLVVEDENGNVIKEEMKDTFHLALHKQITTILQEASKLDPKDTRDVIAQQLDNFTRSQHNMNLKDLNSLCWSIGAVSGSMSSDIEKSFLVIVIKILLNLCENQKTKDAKAVIASCIMYVVRKYPRFLNKHWKFLQTVVKKLVEFLHEKHPGVQDMSIEALQEICQFCGPKFLRIQENDDEIFIRELLNLLQFDMCEDLSHEQKENLYQTWGIVISTEKDLQKSAELVDALLLAPNQSWIGIMETAKHNNEYLAQLTTMQLLTHLLRINKQAASSIGGRYIVQIAKLYVQLLEVYSFYAKQVSDAIKQHGSIVRQQLEIRAMCTVKSEILQLVEVFINKSDKNDHKHIIEQFVPKFLITVLNDYQNSVPAAREAACLGACSELIDKLGTSMTQYVNGIFRSVFQITLDMIRTNMEDFPDHRKNFFRLLRVVTEKCFDVFKQMSNDQIKLVVQCILWSIQHLENSICEIGLQTLQDLIRNVEQEKNTSTYFFQQYSITIIEGLINVLTDTLHKSVISPVCQSLQMVFNAIQNPGICDILWDTNNQLLKYGNNREYIGSSLSSILLKKFPNLTIEVINIFILGLFELSKGNNNDEKMKFQVHCEDFLVQIKELHVKNSPNVSSPPQTK